MPQEQSRLVSYLFVYLLVCLLKNGIRFSTFTWSFVCTMVSACTNCGTPSTCDPRDRCNNLTPCRLCKRRLPIHCFDVADSTICQACEKQKKKFATISSTRQIVTEVEIPTDESDVSFESFSSRNSGHINEVISDYQQRLR